MSKEFLLKTICDGQAEKYSWTLYFLKMDFRSKPNPYFLYKHTFKKSNYLSEYLKSLFSAMHKYQIEPINSVQVYDGENSKTSCDKLDISGELIGEQWNNMVLSARGAPREQIVGKYQGYILDGQPITDGLKPITIAKVCNPIISLEKKNTKVFRHASNNELEAITDEICRLYLIADFAVIGDAMYTFNHAFEGIFRIEKTMQKIKLRAVDEILKENAFIDPETVKKYMKGYTAPNTFLTLRADRVKKLSDPDWQATIAPKLNLNIVNGKIEVKNQEQANQLIKYLCYKIFQDKETDNLIEVNSVVNDNVR